MGLLLHRDLKYDGSMSMLSVALLSLVLTVAYVREIYTQESSHGPLCWGSEYCRVLLGGPLFFGTLISKKQLNS